ncbi:MAG: DNA-binding protein [Prevotella sp.]
MLKYVLKMNTNKTSATYGKWYARAVHDATVSLDELAEHMSQHNTPYSKGAIKGVLTDMVACIKELMLDSKKVKLDDLAIFSLGLSSKPADSEDDFDASKITKARIRALGTGEVSKRQLDMDVSFQRASVVKG